MEKDITECLEDPVILADMLKCQKHPPENSETLISGLVTHCENPWEFYVLPKHISWKMDSTEESKVVDLFKGLVQSMGDYYCKYFNGLKPDEWKINQLVAVAYIPLNTILSAKIELGNQQPKKQNYDYYRAIVTAEVVKNKETGTALVKTFLIDLGVTQVVPINQLARLRVSFIEMQPLAYTCRLFGVSPVASHWSDRAIQFFSKATFGQDCIINVISRKIVPKEKVYAGKFHVQKRVITNEEQFYVVELRVKEHRFYKVPEHRGNQNVCYKSVAEGLIKQHLGLEWNLHPHRPGVSKKVSHSNSMLLFDPNPFRPNTKNDFEDMERDRLIKKLDLMANESIDLKNNPPVLVSIQEKDGTTFGSTNECGDITKKMQQYLQMNELKCENNAAPIAKGK